MYYKESAFAFLCAFGFIHLCCMHKGKKSCKIQTKIFDYGLIVGAIIWFAVYMVVVLIQKGESGFYGKSPYNALLVFAKALFTNICSEPFLYGITFGGFLYRIYAVLLKKSPLNPLFDASIWGSAILLLEYAILRIVSYHYVLPAYIFGLVVIGAGFLLWWRDKWAKTLFILCGIMFVGNTCFTWVYLWAHYKFVPQNFQATLAFVSDDTHKHPQTRIYLESVDRVSNVEVYHSFGKWLEHYGARDFDLLSSDEVDERFHAFAKEGERSVFKSMEAMPKQSGDIVILTPYASQYITKEAISKKYELLFSAEYGYNVPPLGLKAFLKSALLYLGILKGDMILSHNAYGLPLHFYVLRVP